MIEAHENLPLPPSEDWYLAVLVGAIKEKDIPKNAKVVNEKTYKNFIDKKEKEKNKGEKKTAAPSKGKKMTHQEKVGIPQSMAKLSDIVV